MAFRVKLRLKALKYSLFPAAARLPAFEPTCSVCGMAFTDALGRPISMGYVCASPRCPTRVSAVASVMSPLVPSTFLVN